MKLFFYSIIAISFFLSGCTTLQNSVNKADINTPNIINESSLTSNNNDLEDIVKHYDSLNDIIISIANQLLNSNTVKNKQTSIILTSFVDLNSLNETTAFGRILSESMFNELHIRKFKVTDFRGQDAVSVNANGEFHITRDVDKLKDSVEAIEYILVGTYVPFEDESLLINGRIIDSISGEVISSARLVYKPKDCKLYSICTKKEPILVQNVNVQTPTVQEVIEKVEDPKKIDEIEEILQPIEIIEDK